MTAYRLYRAALVAAVLMQGASLLHAQQHPALEEGIRLYLEEGDARRAAALLSATLDTVSPRRSEELRALVFLAQSQFALNDHAAAEISARRAIAIEPCIVPAPELAPPNLARIYRRSRPYGASCDRSAQKVAALSAVVPGLGDALMGRTTSALLHFGTVAGAAYLTYHFDRETARSYDEYRATLDPAQADHLWSQTLRDRNVARGAGVVTALLHAWGIERARRAGRTHQRAVRPFLTYDGGFLVDGDLRFGANVSTGGR